MVRTCCWSRVLCVIFGCEGGSGTGVSARARAREREREGSKGEEREEEGRKGKDFSLRRPLSIDSIEVQNKKAAVGARTHPYGPRVPRLSCSLVHLVSSTGSEKVPTASQNAHLAQQHRAERAGVRGGARRQHREQAGAQAVGRRRLCPCELGLARGASGVVWAHEHGHELLEGGVLGRDARGLRGRGHRCDFREKSA